GGMPATGAIARTATNIRSGARSPIAGMMHAVFLLLFMLVLAPLAVFVPLASLAAVLVVVAWNMSEVHKFRHLMRSPLGDRAVLLLTFALTILVDLTVAIEIGVVLAAIVFMHRMAEVATVQQGASFVEEDIDDFERPRSDTYTQRAALPEGVEVFQLRGPLFFGSAGRLADLLDNIGTLPRVFILRMREVPMIDATGVAALKGFIERCDARGIEVIATAVQPSLRTVLGPMGFDGNHPSLRFADSFEDALASLRP
ncbi:MAG: SulP family inorganic anion transporter, partial [Methylibium sp.]